MEQALLLYVDEDGTGLTEQRRLVDGVRLALRPMSLAGEAAAFRARWARWAADVVSEEL